MNEKIFLYEFKLLMQKYAITFEKFDFSFEGVWSSIKTNSEGEIYFLNGNEVIFAPFEYENFVDTTSSYPLNQEEDYSNFIDSSDDDGSDCFFL